MCAHTWRSHSKFLEQPNSCGDCVVSGAGAGRLRYALPRQVCTVMREEGDSIFIKGVINKSSQLSLLLLLAAPCSLSGLLPSALRGWESHPLCLEWRQSRVTGGSSITVHAQTRFLPSGETRRSEHRKPRKLFISKILHAIKQESK